MQNVKSDDLTFDQTFWTGVKSPTSHLPYGLLRDMNEEVDAPK